MTKWGKLGRCSISQRNDFLNSWKGLFRKKNQEKKGRMIFHAPRISFSGVSQNPEIVFLLIYCYFLISFSMALKILRISTLTIWISWRDWRIFFSFCHSPSNYINLVDLISRVPLLGCIHRRIPRNLHLLHAECHRRLQNLPLHIHRRLLPYDCLLHRASEIVNFFS